jgi:hypothetical protein
MDNPYGNDNNKNEIREMKHDPSATGIGFSVASDTKRASSMMNMNKTVQEQDTPDTSSVVPMQNNRDSIPLPGTDKPFNETGASFLSPMASIPIIKDSDLPQPKHIRGPTVDSTYNPAATTLSNNEMGVGGRNSMTMPHTPGGPISSDNMSQKQPE